MGTPPRVLSESYPMNISVTVFRCFSKKDSFSALYEGSLSIGIVKSLNALGCFLSQVIQLNNIIP